MPEPLTINPEPSPNPGVDYAFLKATGTNLVQQLAGEIWTDYNESDPGVTTLEQLCYALTELSYRAELPLADLLIDPRTCRIDPRRQALFPARRIFPCNPVTEDDYRKLLVDRLPEIANVWLTPHRCREARRCVNGLWDIELYVPGLEPECPPPGENEQKLLNQVRRVYCRHRNLGEDIRSIRVLRPVRTTVKAEVCLLEARTPEAILAGILFNVANFLAPELRRQPLRSLVDAGMPPSAIFNGPLLVNGFIADEQLQPKAETIPVQDVVRVMARSAGVASLRDVKVRVAGEPRTYSGNELIPVPRRSILQLDTRPDGKGGGFSVKLFKNGLEIQPNPARVERELARLWADQRRTYRLAAQYAEYFGFPEGHYQDVERYYSIQNQYPNVYGINAYGVGSDATVVRKAQAKQLKGYLLVFDQLLADFFAQLAHVRDLYSTVEDLPSTYYYQYLDRSVPNIEPLLIHGEEGYRRGLPEIVRSQDPVVTRRNRFLEFLLALYAERLDDSSVWDLTPGDEEDADTGARLIRARRALLRHLTASTHNRGRGFDYLERPSRGNIAGLEIKSRIQLGMGALDPRPLVDVLDELGVELAAAGTDSAMGRPLRRQTDHIQEQLTPVPLLTKGSALPGPGALLPRGFAVPEELLGAGGRIAELRVGTLPGETAVAAVWKSAGEEDWRLLGKYGDRQSAEDACRAFAGLLGTLRRHCRQLYIVEHNLLRFGRFRRPNPGFVYSFTITAVLSAPPDGNEDYLRFAREVIRENTPAHIVVDDCFLGPRQMRDFESLYWAWRRALREQDRRQIIDTSVSLRNFLQK